MEYKTCIKCGISLPATNEYFGKSNGHLVSRCKKCTNEDNRERYKTSDRHRYKNGVSDSRWKGDDVSYRALHGWLQRHKTRMGICDECGKQGRTHYANISGEYKRDVNDYRELCSRCHLKLDGNNRRKDIDDDEIKRLYVDEGLSTVEIADLFKSNHATISKRLNKLGIPRRKFTRDIDNEEIKRLYLEEKLSTVEIASRFGTNYETIRERLIKAGTMIRTQKEAKECIRSRGKTI